MNEQMNALDATFLELEEADQSAHMHIGGLMIFEPRPDGRAPSVAEVAARIEAGLENLPRYSHRLSTPTTGGLHWPRWVWDDRFRVADHIRTVSLPPPGGDAELIAWAGEFFSQRLDRTRPLWENVIVGGLSDGRWAIASKTHHCMVDGVGSIDAIAMLLDTERDAPAPQGWYNGEVRPPELPSQLAAAIDTADRITRLPVRAAKIPVNAAKAVAGLIGGTARVARHPHSAADALKRSEALAEVIVKDELNSAPRSSLNLPIGAKRRLAVYSIPLADLKQVKNALGGTVNDVVLAMATGGLRRLLIERRETPPEQGLRAMVPVNLRAAGEELALGNKITSLFVHLPVSIADPIERYATQVAEAETLKSGSQALGSTTLIDLTKHAPPVIHSFIARSLFATRLFNVTITNVPGPQFPLYALGSRMLEIWPLVPLASDHSVGLAVLSYDGTLYFTLNADRESMPDLEVLMSGMRDSFEELREAAATNSIAS
jgi:WS/DGAT/MGAT family acyltransferase